MVKPDPIVIIGFGIGTAPDGSKPELREEKNSVLDYPSPRTTRQLRTVAR